MASDIEKWNTWINHLGSTTANTSVTVSNIEKTLKEYRTVSKRMLWFNTILMLGVIGLNGILLFYK